jgi:hypothetical protein
LRSASPTPSTPAAEVRNKTFSLFHPSLVEVFLTSKNLSDVAISYKPADFGLPIIFGALCTAGTVSMTVYSGSDCTGTSSSVTEAAGTCNTDDDDDGVADDNSYSPGDGSVTMKVTCTSGAASLANSLGAKAVLAIVLGAVAFLSM